ncbi:hypothetical protein COH21_012978 [Aspergillus flavus]|nr:hypothetical protein COH21_012978 [Aspergillus flavus]
MATVYLRSPDGRPVMPNNSTVADLVNRGFQELKIKPMEFAKAYMGDQLLPINDLLKEHQSDESAALEITSEDVDELKVDLMFKFQEMMETLEFTGAEPRELLQLTILWLDAIARAGYSVYGEYRSRTVIEAYLIPTLAIVNTGVDYSNYQLL